MRSPAALRPLLPSPLPEAPPDRKAVQNSLHGQAILKYSPDILPERPGAPTLALGYAAVTFSACHRFHK